MHDGDLHTRCGVQLGGVSACERGADLADERDRAIFMGVRAVRSILDELVAYFDGQISRDEDLALEWNMKIAAARPHTQKAYELIKGSYSKKIQRCWESIETSDTGTKLRSEIFNER